MITWSIHPHRPEHVADVVRGGLVIATFYGDTRADVEARIGRWLSEDAECA